MSTQPHRDYKPVVYMAARSTLAYLPGDDSRKYLTEYHVLWYNYLEGSYEIEIYDMAKFSIMPDGTIIPGDGFEDNPKAQEFAKSRAKAKKSSYKSKKDRGIVSMREFQEAIPDEEAAVEFVEDAIWGGTPACPRCDGSNVYQTKNGKPMRWRCRPCRRHFSVRIGTVLEDTNLPYKTWLLAIRFMLTGRKGISALQLEKELGVKYLTAWFLEHRIREAMNMTDEGMLSGIVQVDEAWIGGKAKNIHKSKKAPGWNWKDNKFAIIGAKTADGRTLIIPVPAGETKSKFVVDNIKKGSTVWTDEDHAFSILSKYGFDHDFVSHKVGEYVRNIITTNGIESMWALFKRGYNGTFHYMSWEHLHRYCNEFAYRDTHGHGNGPEAIAAVLRRMVGERLTYERLIENSPDKKQKPK